MKKLIILSVFAFSFLFANAQENSNFDKFLDYDQTWFTYAPSATTYALTLTDSTWYFSCLSEKYLPVTVDYKLVLDSVGGTAASVPVVLRGKKFLSDDYTPVDTVTWTNGSDTTIKVSYATESKYRYWQIYMVGASDGFIVNIDELSMKFWQ